MAADGVGELTHRALSHRTPHAARRTPHAARRTPHAARRLRGPAGAQAAGRA
ncbi:succinylglutamate desuccinylase [Burkholderia cepacia]|uniref:succinylglutamate desuccinylase n=1 Tax=Burkholderia cepacia TaxID=292 RepID=UPI001628E8CF|nr:succinylglutamate desuccinylase [Burkholderia cepacia]